MENFSKIRNDNREINEDSYIEEYKALALEYLSGSEINKYYIYLVLRNLNLADIYLGVLIERQISSNTHSFFFLSV
jgi:hypothetical protein